MSKHLSATNRILGRLSPNAGIVEELQLLAGSGVSITLDSTNGTITIAGGATLAVGSPQLNAGEVLFFDSNGQLGHSADFTWNGAGIITKLGTFSAVRETFNDYGTIASGATCTVEMDKYGVVRIQAPPAGSPPSSPLPSFTIAFSGVPASGTVQGVLIEAIDWGSAMPTLPAAAKWASATVPTLTASGMDILRVYTRDGGTTYRFALVDLDSR